MQPMFSVREILQIYYYIVGQFSFFILYKLASNVPKTNNFLNALPQGNNESLLNSLELSALNWSKIALVQTPKQSSLNQGKCQTPKQRTINRGSAPDTQTASHKSRQVRQTPKQRAINQGKCVRHPNSTL